MVPCISLISLHLFRASGRNLPPYLPGSTVITMTPSTSSRWGSTHSTPVSGFKARITLSPRFFTYSTESLTSSSVSTWRIAKSILPAMPPILSRGSTTMRWASYSNTSGRTKSKFKDVFGTNSPSMMSSITLSTFPLRRPNIDSSSPWLWAIIAGTIKGSIPTFHRLTGYIGAYPRGSGSQLLSETP